jgi:hypothetical protein
MYSADNGSSWSTFNFQFSTASVMSLSTASFNAWKLIEQKIVSWIAPVIQFPPPTKTIFLSLVSWLMRRYQVANHLALGLLHCYPHPFPTDKSVDFATVCTGRFGSNQNFGLVIHWPIFCLVHDLDCSRVLPVSLVNVGAGSSSCLVSSSFKP